MAAAPVVPGATHIRKRSFFFALSRDLREFVFRGANKERLVMSTLSLGFGARDEVHVLEAEGASADREKNVPMLVQATAMLGVQPSLPAVTLNSTVLALPVTFKLRSGPGPLYVSGSHLVCLEEAGTVGSVTTTAKSLPTASEEPAQKRASISAQPLVAKVELNVNKPLSFPASGAKDSFPAMFAAKYGDHGASTSSSPSPAVTDTKASKKTYPEGSREERRNYDRLNIKNQKILSCVRAKIMAGVLKGMRPSVVQLKFERYLKHNHKVTDPNLVAELWKWRQTLNLK